MSRYQAPTLSERIETAGGFKPYLLSLGVDADKFIDMLDEPNKSAVARILSKDRPKPIMPSTIGNWRTEYYKENPEHATSKEN